MAITLPLFKDGQILGERQLYELAAFARDWARLSTGGTPNGFFAPPHDVLEKDAKWNGVEVDGNHVLIRPLFLLHQGFPFINTKPERLISECSSDLYACLRIASSAEGRSDTDPGYTVQFSWSATTMRGPFISVVKIATRRTINPLVFDLAPPAIIPAAIPELEAQVEKLAEEAKEFQKHLVKHAIGLPSDAERSDCEPVDRDIVMFQLRRLAVITRFAPMSVLMAELQLTIRAIRGFFLRLRFAEQPDRWPKAMREPLKRLRGAVLEDALQLATKDCYVHAGLPKTWSDPETIDGTAALIGAAAQIGAIAGLANAMSESGELRELLIDKSIPLCRDYPYFPTVRDHVGIVYNCAGIREVLVNLPVEAAGNVTYQFANRNELPKRLLPLDLKQVPGGQRQALLKVSGDLLFLSAPKSAALAVQSR